MTKRLWMIEAHGCDDSSAILTRLGEAEIEFLTKLAKKFNQVAGDNYCKPTFTITYGESIETQDYEEEELIEVSLDG